MPSVTRIAPWWERWREWWRSQTFYLSAPSCRGQFTYCSEVHAARWDGTLDAAGQRRRVTIAWGPGTPFFPPRVYPHGCYSTVHQYSDGSMCLSPPATLNRGWHGVPDISFWLKQAASWFEGYERGDWAIEPDLCLWLAISLPAPEYRSVQPGGVLMVIPPTWKNGPPAPRGTFRARVPRDRAGMGAVVSWRSPDHEKTQTWPSGEALVTDGEMVRGMWEHLPSLEPAALREAAMRLRDRRVDRAQARQQTRAMVRGRQFLVAVCVPSPWDEGDNLWVFHLMPSPKDLITRMVSPQFDPLAPGALHALYGPRFRGVLMDRAHLEARRIAQGDRKMHEKIAATTVVLVGLGALGSEVAHLLAQEGVTRYLLVDGDLLLPGNVARHRANLTDAGRTKVDAIERDILLGRPLPTLITARKETSLPFDTSTMPVHFWNPGSPSDDRKRLFLEHWERCVNRPPLVRTRELV